MAEKPERPALKVGELVARSRANGPGTRTVVWVQGCGLDCPGCINQHLLPKDGGHTVDPVVLGRRLVDQEPEVEGLTLSGGEPFEQPAACAYLLATVRAKGWSTVVYTGHQLEDLRVREDPWVHQMLSRIDLLIDGPFQAELRTEELPWRGSKNQKIHCLSSRYSELKLDLQKSPVEEILLNLGDATAIRSGILSRLGLKSLTEPTPLRGRLE